jgi:hypothetical protein
MMGSFTKLSLLRAWMSFFDFCAPKDAGVGCSPHLHFSDLWVISLKIIDLHAAFTSVNIVLLLCKIDCYRIDFIPIKLSAQTSGR